MLRRYSSRGVDTVSIESRRTIGRKNCDFNIEGPGVCSPHAAIEIHPFTRTYWLRELSLTGTTTVNGQAVNGQIELHNCDLIRLGEAQPLIFSDDSLLPMRKTDYKTPTRSYEHAVQNGGILPVLGHKIEPQQTNWRPLNGSVRGSSSQRKARPKRESNGFRERRINATGGTPSPFAEDSKSSGYSIDSNSELSPRATGVSGSVASVGNSLLQRVVRLQAEVSRKDEEILVLVHRLRLSDEQIATLRSGKRYSFLQEIPRQRLSNASTIVPLNFELEAYRSFVHIISLKLNTFNERVLRQPQKDYANVFLNFSRELEEPFGNKMAEIEDECRSELHTRGFDDLQLARLRAFLADDTKEHISSLACELEVIFPVLRDATTIAKESIKACTVFTQWSRHLGDNLRAHGMKSSLLNHAIDCLKDQFAVSEMSRHWLPPSVAPLLRLIALDLENRETRREKETQTDELEPEDIKEKTPSITAQSSEEEAALIVHHVTSDACDLVQNPTNLDRLIQQTEETTLMLQREIDILSENIHTTLDLDKETEQHLEDLFNVLVSTGDSMHKLALNDRKTSKDSILSVEVKQSDLEEGLQYYRDDSFKLESPPADSSDEILLRGKRYNLNRNSSDRVSIIEEEPEEITDSDSHLESMEAFRARLLAQLGTEPSALSNVKVLVRKDIIMDLIFAAQQLSAQLQSKKDEESRNVSQDHKNGEQKIEAVHASVMDAAPSSDDQEQVETSSKLETLREESREGDLPDEDEDDEDEDDEDEVQSSENDDAEGVYTEEKGNQTEREETDHKDQGTQDNSDGKVEEDSGDVETEAKEEELKRQESDEDQQLEDDEEKSPVKRSVSEEEEEEILPNSLADEDQEENEETGDAPQGSTSKEETQPEEENQEKAGDAGGEDETKDDETSTSEAKRHVIPRLEHPSLEAEDHHEEDVNGGEAKADEQTEVVNSEDVNHELEESTDIHKDEEQKEEKEETQEGPKEEGDADAEKQPTAFELVPDSHGELRIASATGERRQSRPRSARPRTSIDRSKTNGIVLTGTALLKRSGGVQSLDSEGLMNTHEVTAVPKEDDEWSQGGTEEEVNLSLTTPASVASTIAKIERTETVETEEDKERKLMEARRLVNVGLADQLLNSPKPKSICELSHSAHIQSHINTASRYPYHATYQKVPVKSLEFSPPVQRKTVQKKRTQSEERPPLRQPRMQFKL